MENSRTMIEHNDESALHGLNSTTECTYAESATENNNCDQLQLSQKKTHCLNLNWKKIIETIFLTFVFIIVWCLFTIPTVLYALSASQSPQGGSHNNGSESQNSSLYLRAGELMNQSVASSSSNFSPEDHTITCAEGFYLDNSSVNSTICICVPLCGYWISTSRNLGKAVVEAISLISAIVSSLIMVVLAFWLQRDIILVHPTVFLLYICLTLATTSSIILVGVLIKSTVFCSSDNLLESLEHESPYCTISGFVHTYALGQLSLWIVFHALGLLRGIAFPFFYRNIKREGSLKYIHISMVVVALVLPLVPALLHLKDGYGIVPSPINICTGRNIAVNYYGLVLPISILFATTTTVLILLFRKIVKEFVVKPVVNEAFKGHIRNAQAKLLLIMCYYTLFGVVIITSYTSFFTMGRRGTDTFQSYFTCQSLGVQADLDCGQPPYIAFYTLASVSIILGGLMPGVILIFTTKCSCFKKCHQNVQVPQPP